MALIHKPMKFYNGIYGVDWNLDELKYPVIVSPKWNGEFVMKDDDVVTTRQGKPFANQYVNDACNKVLKNGMNAELIIKDKTFHQIAGYCNSKYPKVKYPLTLYVFDWVWNDPREQYINRIKRINFNLPIICDEAVAYYFGGIQLNNKEDVLKFHNYSLEQGAEGIVIRDPEGPYKWGRSTKNEAYAFKMIEIVTKIGTIVGFTENSVKSNTIGAIRIDTDEYGPIIVGSGFDNLTGINMKTNPESFIDKKVYYQYRPHGMQLMPRQPIFGGFV